MHLYLCGYRGTGKSSVASSIAERLNRPTIDLDAEIVQAADRSIAEIFADGGEESFRNHESDALLRSSQSETPMVISLGGGAILRQQNRATIASTGHCAWLTADADTILHRISSDAASADQRPALTDKSLRDEIVSMLETRDPLYREASDQAFSTEDRSIEEVAAEIARWWELSDRR